MSNYFHIKDAFFLKNQSMIAVNENPSLISDLEFYAQKTFQIIITSLHHLLFIREVIKLLATGDVYMRSKGLSKDILL